MSNTESLIVNYRPQYADYAPENWATVADFVRTTVRAYATGRGYEQVRVALIALAYFADWLLFAGLDEPTAEMLRGELIELYVAARSDEEVEDITRAKQRKVLLSIAGLPTPRELGRPARTVSTPLAPYGKREQSEIRSWAIWQPNEVSRLSAHGFVGLGLGAGLTRAELPFVHRDHVIRTGEGLHVTVTGKRARRVRVDERWVDLIEYAVQHSANYLMAPLAVRRTVVNSDYWLDRARGEAPLPSRMRNTWLLARMDSGISAEELTRIAGLKNIRSLERFVRTHAPQHRALMHGARSKR